MATGSDFPSTPATAEISLVRGGPFYRVAARGRSHPHESLGPRPPRYFYDRRWLAAAVCAHCAFESGWFGFADTRLSCALPPAGCRSGIADRRTSCGIALSRCHRTSPPNRASWTRSELARVDGVIATIIRARDSFLPEFVIVLLLIVHTAASYKGLVDTTPWLSRASGS